MQLASDAGATIFPAIPTLYNHPQTTTDMARNFIHASSPTSACPNPAPTSGNPTRHSANH
jgi:4-hydroxy-3-polyprenylbenzoate decarboxylase